MKLDLYDRLRSLKIRFQHLRYRVPNVHRTTYLAKNLDLAPDLTMGAYGYIGPFGRICPNVTIGNYAMFGPEVCITGQDHNFDLAGTPTIFSGRPEHPMTQIGHDVWIASRALIHAGVKIGNGAIVASGAVVSNNVEDYDIVAGIPAKPIRKRFSPEQIAVHEGFLALEPLAGDFCRSIEIKSEGQ